MLSPAWRIVRIAVLCVAAVVALLVAVAWYLEPFEAADEPIPPTPAVPIADAAD